MALRVRGERPREDPLKLLANATARRILACLGRGPSYPREIARTLHLSEGDAQRKLHRLEAAGLVAGAWHHEGKTVKEYPFTASSVELDLSDGSIVLHKKQHVPGIGR